MVDTPNSSDRTDKAQPLEKLFWLDMEMTGLDVEKERVIEVAVIVTDLTFEEVGYYHTIVKQPQEFIDNMDEWNRTHHSQSGLIDKIPEGKNPVVVDRELCEFATRHVGRNRVVIAGNSIFQDRRFIDKYFTDFKALLHYRMLDVTSWKIILKHKYHVEYSKKESHRALDDIRESISELKYYLEYFDLK